MRVPLCFPPWPMKRFSCSACGGAAPAPCANARCSRVEEVSFLPNGLFTRREQLNQWRLGCQVKSQGGHEDRHPAGSLRIKKWECEVISKPQRRLLHQGILVKLPEGEKLDFKSGLYQIDVPVCEVDYRADIFVEEEYRTNGISTPCGPEMKNPEPIFRLIPWPTNPQKAMSSS